MREELLPTPRLVKKAKVKKPKASPLLTVNNTLSSRQARVAPSSSLPPSSPPPPSSLPIATSPTRQIPLPTTTIFPNTVATVLAWIKEGDGPVDINVHSRADGRIRLADFKVDLGRQNCKQTNNLQVYRVGSRRWVRLPTNAPLLLNKPGEIIFIKYEHIKYPDGFVDYLQVEHGFGYEEEPEHDDAMDDPDSDLEMWISSPLDKKGKGRAF